MRIEKIIQISTVLLFVFLANSSFAQVEELKTGAFAFEIEVKLLGSTNLIYDAISGDISGWWDHTFSKQPKKFHIETKPGGGFWEIFDEEGNGVKHAEVIYADRGKLLRFDGPLGLSGQAIKVVTTYTFTESGADSTLLKVSVRGSGELAEGTSGIVYKVWKHFILDRFKNYIESGKHLTED